jgi:conserved repeat domain
MKKARKVLSVALVALMAFALSAAAVFAAPTKGTIKVTDTKKDQTYTLYKLFDATITFNDDDTQRAIAYTVPEGKTLAEDNAWFTVNAEGTVEAKEGVSDDWAKDSEAIAWAKSFGTQVGEAKTADSDGAEVKWEDLDWGYYFVDSTLGAFISVTSDNPDGEVKDKNELPTIAKVITAVSAGSNTDDAAIAEMGATVTFKVTVGAKAGAENYVVTDTLPAGITAPAAADVTVEGADVKVEGQVITVTFKKDYLDAIKEAKDIEITYTGVVNGDAVIGAEGNKNSAVLAWGHSDNNKTEPVVVTVYTAQVEITKVDNEGNALEGAGFVIEKDGKFYKFADGAVSWVDSEDDATEKFSDAEGKVEAFVGLGADGTYNVVEKTVPDGFNRIDKKSVVIKTAAEDVTDANLKQTVEVENKIGVTLPETGAMGTQIFYIIGVLAILGAGVFMVTNKRIAKEEI